MKNHLKINTSYHQFIIELGLKELTKYQDFIELFLENEKQGLEIAYRKKLSQLKYDDQEGYSKITEEHYYKRSDIVHLFPHNFRASFLIQIVTFIETSLVEICEQYEFINNTNYSIHDLKANSDMEKAKIFLVKSCGANFDNLNPEWQFILIIKKTRNSLIHNQGHVKKVEKDWTILNHFNIRKDFYEFIPNVDSVEAPRLILKNRKLTEKLLIVTEKFFEKLLKQIDY